MLRWFGAALIGLTLAIVPAALAGAGHDDNSHAFPVTGKEFARALEHQYPAIRWAACRPYRGGEALFVCNFTAIGGGQQCAFEALLIDTAWRAWKKPVPVACHLIA